ncbi:MAG: hypothetical protein PWQ38_868, partial [Proteiniphilum sp.]|nr:hypothetical protein [Proteiniphilum sp.]
MRIYIKNRLFYIDFIMSILEKRT